MDAADYLRRKKTKGCSARRGSGKKKKKTCPGYILMKHPDRRIATLSCVILCVQDHFTKENDLPKKKKSAALAIEC